MNAFLIGIVLLASTAFAACLPVTGNRILARDLAAADPQFSTLPATLTVGFAPAPGTQRIFPVAELERIARANGVKPQMLVDICFELPMTVIGESDAIAAMRRSLPPEATLTIIELPKSPVPAGLLEFPIEGLEPASPATPSTQLWRGNILYAETHKTATWARVAIVAPYTAVVAVKDLPANTAIEPASVRVEIKVGPIERAKVAGSLEDVRHRMPKLAVKAGATIPLSILIDTPDVRRGDSVQVEVQSGPAHLQFVAVAESSAREGDMIELRNPLSGKTFRAKLDPGARAVVIVPGGPRL